MSNQDVSIPIEWVELELDSRYEIATTTPHQIRKKADGRIVKEHLSENGYLRCSLSKRKFLKHVIIANQFIDNPDNLPFIDHINHNRVDNRIENLRFCTNQQNSNQRIDQTFVDNIPEEAIEVKSYADWSFDFLYFHDNIFYVYNGINYVVKPRFQNKRGMWFISCTDTSGKQRTIYYSKFKREYDLI